MTKKLKEERERERSGEKRKRVSEKNERETMGPLTLSKKKWSLNTLGWGRERVFYHFSKTRERERERKERERRVLKV